MQEELIEIITFYAIWFVIGLYPTSIIANKDALFFAPTHIYKESDRNIFGCILTTIVYFVVFPIYCVIGTIVWVVWWLCHVGRKD